MLPKTSSESLASFHDTESGNKFSFWSSDETMLSLDCNSELLSLLLVALKEFSDTDVVDVDVVGVLLGNSWIL